MSGLGKPKRPTIGEFVRAPDKRNIEDPRGGYWQHITANKAFTSCERVADILRTQVIPNFGKYEFDDLEPLQIEK